MNFSKSSNIAIQQYSNMNPRRGFTLIELLVSVTIFVLILIVLNQTLITTFRSATKSEVSTQVKQEAENVVQTMTRELRNARNVQQGGIEDANDGIRYQTAAGQNRNFACYDIPTGQVDQSIAGNRVRLTTNTVAVTSCSFNVLDNRTVDINLSFQQRVGTSVEQQASHTVQTRVLLRN